MSRLLIIEDDPGSRMVLKSRLVDQGHLVAVAENGAQGLMEARSGTFDLFLVAAGLASGVDGFEVCRRLKGTPGTNAIPIVLFTNRASGPEDLDRGYEAGCEIFVTKAEQSTMDHVLRTLLRLKTSIDRLSERNRAIEEAHSRLVGERQRDGETDGQKESGEHAQALREIASGKPDGVLLVDSEGCVRSADRGACELLGNRIEGQHLGSLAPASGLEAFTRDARTEARTGFRFDLAARRGQVPRSLIAAVVPLVSFPSSDAPALKVLFLGDAAKRRLAADLLRIDEPCISRREAGALLEAGREVYSPSGLIGASAAMDDVRAEVARASRTLDPVSILGEPGTGKERVARTLHYSGSSTGSFQQVRCSAIQPENLDRELFGCVKGALPGALEDRPGLLHRAQDGTLLLEEFTEIDPAVQRKLVGVLRSGTLTRVGTSKAERIDVRLVGTSSKPVDAALREGRLLPELHEELSRAAIALPPLRERAGDVEILARHFLVQLGACREVVRIADEVLDRLARHAWPGNVGELRDCIDQACARAHGPAVELADLPAWLTDQQGAADRDLIPRPKSVPRGAASPGSRALPLELAALDERRPWDITDEDPVSLELYEKKALLRAIEVVGGDKLAAARLLKVGKSTLYRKLKRFGIQ